MTSIDDWKARALLAEQKLGLLAYYFLVCETSELGAAQTEEKRHREKHRLHAKLYRSALRATLKAINGRLKTP